MSCEAHEYVDLYLNNDHTLLIDNLQGYLNGTLSQLNTATADFQIYDMDDVLIVGASGSLTPVGSGGDYKVHVDKTIANLLTKGNEYRIAVSGVQSGADFEFNLYVRVKRRGDS